MIAVCDQSPLHYMILINCDHVLPQLYERVITPRVVITKEMSDPKTPEVVRRWAASPPSWLEVREPHRVEDIPVLSRRGDRGAGELAAIALGLELRAEGVRKDSLEILLDDTTARREVRARDLHPVWTLNVLDQAAERGLITDLSDRLDTLVHQTPFRCGPQCQEAIKGMRQRDLQRKQAQELDQARLERLAREQISPTHGQKRDLKLQRGFGRGM